MLASYRWLLLNSRSFMNIASLLQLRNCASGEQTMVKSPAVLQTEPPKGADVALAHQEKQTAY